MGVVVRRYIDFLILLIPSPLVLLFFAAASLLFNSFLKCFLFFNIYTTLSCTLSRRSIIITIVVAEVISLQCRKLLWKQYTTRNVKNY